MNKFLFTILIAFTSLGAYSQTFKQNHNFDLALSVGSNEMNGALSWSQIHGITKNQKFKLGYGLRANYFTGSDKMYTTAPAELTSGKTGPAVFFSETINNNIDTFQVGTSTMGSINASIHIEYSLKPKWDIGFNIDAFGFSFGKEVSGEMTSSVAPTNSVLTQTANPTKFNVLLISDNDIGTLNSELYVRYALTRKAAIRVGFTFLFTEYTTTNKIAYNFDNERFRYKTLMGMVAFSFAPFK